jgi:CheY-like chemotaxis protein
MLLPNTSRGMDSPEAPTILMVEDEAVLRETIAECLRDWGYHVLEASNAQAAIGLITAAKQIDVIFTDVRMPGRMDGFGLARWVRERHPEMPILVTTGYEGPGSGSTLDLHDGPILRKPYDLGTLHERLRALLAKTKGGRGSD